MDMITFAMAKKYTDQKAGYADKTVVTGETSVSLYYDEDTGGYVGEFQSEVDLATVLELRNERPMFNVYWNGKMRECNSVETGGLFVTGNLSMFGGADTGEPFTLICDEGNHWAVIKWQSRDNYDITIVSVSIEHEIIYPIDPKFIPGVCLPVVELSTPISAALEKMEMTAEETAAVTNVLASNDYAIANFIFDSKPMLAVCMKTEVDGIPALVGYFHILRILVGVADDIGIAAVENAL